MSADSALQNMLNRARRVYTLPGSDPAHAATYEKTTGRSAPGSAETSTPGAFGQPRPTDIASRLRVATESRPTLQAPQSQWQLPNQDWMQNVDRSLPAGGWQHYERLLRERVANAPSAAQGAAGALYTKISDAMKQYIGTPYRWGGTGNGGFDCSGFTQRVARDTGFSLPRTASQQWNWFRQNGRSVPANQARPGDFVYFRSSASPSGWHTGIFIGDGMMIDAPGTGRTVGRRRIGNRNIVGFGRLG